MNWDKHKKPPDSICPEAFCFLWSESKGCCRETFGKCRRSTANQSDTDWYEPCEPELEKQGLPWFYFTPNVNILVEELREKYIKESSELWGSAQE